MTRSQRSRTAAAVAIAGMVLTFAGCGGDEARDTAPDTTTSEAPVTTTTPPSRATTTVAPDPTTTSASPPDTTTTTVVTTTTASGVDHLFEIEVTADGGVTGPDRPDVTLDAVVRIIVSGDVTDEVHVHGYDLYADVAPDAPAEIEFSADVPGIFEVELEVGHTLLMELRVG